MPKSNEKELLKQQNFGIDEMSEYYLEKPVALKSERFLYGPNEVSNSLMNVIKGFGKKYGFINSDIISDWDKIAGDDLASKIIPVKLLFPMGKRQNGTLYVKIKNASFSSVIQYQFPVIIDRINTYFGYNAVSNVKIKY